MLKALKWAYDLGVRQERVRISAHLQNISRQVDFNENRMFEVLHSERTPKNKKNQLEFELAVERKIKDAVENIMRPQPSDYFGYSVMFPDDKHKGEK